MLPKKIITGVAALTLGCGVAAQTGAAGTVPLPPANADFDYQLGGAYPPPAAVRVVVRDRFDPPLSTAYSICYVNGFQTQPGESAWWLAHHPDLLLRTATGTPVRDPDWPGEYILDISTPTKRTQLAEVVGSWIDGCARSGYQGVEIDNLDTFTRFPGLLTSEQAIDYARRLTDRAHLDRLAIAQKNTVELVGARARTGYDFAIAEQCSQYGECAAYTAGYGQQVYMVEYRATAFRRGCARFANVSIVLRDRDLVATGQPGYVRRSC